jgi:hypothetical protein
MCNLDTKRNTTPNQYVGKATKQHHTGGRCPYNCNCAYKHFTQILLEQMLQVTLLSTGCLPVGWATGFFQLTSPAEMPVNKKPA